MLPAFTREQNDILWALGQRMLHESDREAYLARLRQECDRWQIGLVFMEQEAYPPILRQIQDPPPVLFYRGNLSLAYRTGIAIVGTRRTTAYGEKAAYEIAACCAKAGLIVVSGMARGIDSCAHKGALDAGGDTIALMPTGLDLCYPPANNWLYDRIISRSLALSEYPPGVKAEKWFFLGRNRLISGLSLATVVVQAGGRSGAVNTAQHAAEQGRDLYAVPGSIFEFASVGTHRLIADGAELVNSVHMVADRYKDRQMSLDEMAAGGEPRRITIHQDIPQDEAAKERADEGSRASKTAGEWQWLYEAIDDFGSLAEQLVEKTGESPQRIQTGLTILEMRGLTERRDRQKIYRK